MHEINKYITSRLFALQDTNYKNFNSKLIPNIDKSMFIGVRTPELKKFAKELAQRDDVDVFLSSLPHEYFEENQLHAFIISQNQSCSQVFEMLEKFLPFVDNWATCDQMNPKIFNKHKTELIEQIYSWINSGETYTIRFSLNMLMTYFLDVDFKEEYLATAAAVVSDEYYVKMMVAWYFATALAKQYNSTLPYLTEYKLSKWVHNKTIQKAVESYRITPEQKEYLRTLKK